MQVTTRSKNLKLSELADDINAAARECDEACVQSIANAAIAVQCAIRAGQGLNRVKKAVGHGKFMKWLSENCKAVSYGTAKRWMKLANSQSVANLEDAKSVNDAFRIIADIQSERSKEEKRALGTAAVDLYVELAEKIAKRAKSVIDIAVEVEPDELTPERREAVCVALQPIIDLGARLGVRPSEEKAA